MSDEPTAKDQTPGWSMPEPVFRTSEGRTPKAVKPEIDHDDIHTEIPDLDEVQTGNQQPDAPSATPANTVRATSAKVAKPKSGRFNGVWIIVSILGVLAVAAAVVYFLF